MPIRLTHQALFGRKGLETRRHQRVTVEASDNRVCIGINDYPYVGKLRFCAEDAVALGKTLVDVAGFSSKRVAVLADGMEPRNLPTLGNLRARIDQFASLPEPGDTVVVFFSGHGARFDGQGYLLRMDGCIGPDTSLSLAWVKERLGASRAATRFLILLMCHAGTAKGVAGLAPSLADSSRLQVLASCAADPISFPDEDAVNRRGGGSLFHPRPGDRMTSF